MPMTRLTPLLLLLFLPSLAFAEPRMSVQEALDYQVPENTCTKPEIVGSATNVSPPMQDSSGVPYFQGSSTASISDVDGYELERQERQEARWKKCLASYKQGLLDDMERLKSSAEHGLTQEQAYAILANMKRVQDVYLTPDGVLPPSETAEP